jgi:hypothetical protein
VDDAERIDAFLPELAELISEGLAIVDDVDVVRYVGRAEGNRDGAGTSGTAEP